MSARYSLLIIVVVTVILTINSLWFHKAKDQICADCGNIDQVKSHPPE